MSQKDKGIKKTIPFTITSKMKKILSYKFNKRSSLYTENCKTVLKEIKDLHKWKDIHIHGSERFDIIEVILPKLIYSFNTMVSKSQAL